MVPFTRWMHSLAARRCSYPRNRRGIAQRGRLYVRHSHTQNRLAKSKAKAEYFERNLRLIDVLIDQDAIRSGAAADGQPWRYYDLGHGLCTYDFFDTCPHRMACAKCSFYVPKGSSLEQIIEGKANLLRMKQELSLTEEEVGAVDDGLAALDALQQKLARIPTPGGPTPRQLEESLQKRAFISAQTIKKRLSKE